jgi:hypothetical protein
VRARSGGWVLVAAGEYRERLAPPVGASLHVVGVCAARVTLRGPGPTGVEGATVAVGGARTELDLDGVTVTGEGRGLLANNGATLRATRVAVVGNLEAGVFARNDGTRVELSGCLVRGTRARGDGVGGRGIDVGSGASARVDRVRLSGNTEAGVLANGAGTTVELASCAVDDTRARGDGVLGQGIYALAGASFYAAGVVITRSSEAGVMARDLGTRVDLESCVIRGTRPHPDGMFGHGVDAQEGAALRATDVDIRENAEIGVHAISHGTVVELAASVVRGGRPREDGSFGYGMEVDDGATLRAARVIAEHNAQGAVVANDADTLVELSSCVLRGSGADGADGQRGLVAQRGATVRATGLLVVDAVGAGVVASDKGTVLELSASSVRGTRTLASGQFGRGVEANLGATLRATRLLVADEPDIGVRANGVGTRVELTEGVIRSVRTLSRRGLEAGAGASMSVTGTRVTDMALVRVLATDAGTRVELTSCVVRGVRSTEPDAPGTGLQAGNGAALEATRVLVASNAATGVLATGRGTRMDLTSSVVRGTRPMADGTLGNGLHVQSGASLRATGLSIEDNYSVGATINNGVGTSADLVAVAVRGTRQLPDGTFGRGVEASGDTLVRATLLLCRENAESGLIAIDRETRMVLDDVLVDGVASSSRGFGVGLDVLAGARVTGARLAIQRTAGAAVLALPYQTTAPSSVTVRDLFVREVRSGTVRFSEDDMTSLPEGRAVAYGLHAGAGCTLDVTRAVLDGGGFGFFNANGVIRVHTGVIAHQLDAAGAVDLATPASAWTLDDVCLAHNTSDGVVRRSDLPTASSLPAPSTSP